MHVNVLTLTVPERQKLKTEKSPTSRATRHLCRAMSVTLHTNHGDIKVEIFCDSVPRTAFNFLALCSSDYYNGTLFHRNIKGVMLQGGDPSGTGKGGDSIWGCKFGDEIQHDLIYSGCFLGCP